ncbi:hypothetical protein D3C81_2307220 [compost metagenome]
MFDSIINKDIISRQDLEVIIDNIVVDTDGNPEINLKDNIDILLENNEVVTYALT